MITARGRCSSVIRGLVIAGMVLWSLGPIMVALVTSVSTPIEAAQSPPVWFPRRLTLNGYAQLLGISTVPPGSVAGQFGRSLLNSATVTVEATVLVLAISVLAGYAFARISFPGRSLVLGIVVASLIVPLFAVVVPLFRIMTDVDLVDTQLGLVLLYASAYAPFGVWMFVNHCRQLPVSPEEAAVTDGCTRIGALWRVVVPQMLPGIVALGGILFLSVWSQFLIPLLFAPSPGVKPATVLVTQLVGSVSVPASALEAAGILAMIPPVAVALVLNRSIRRMLAGAVA